MKFSGTRIAVLRGGPSSHYEHSLKTGEHVLSALRELPDYEPLDIFISRDGEWHRDGLVEEPHEALRHVDLVWNALHGSYGADGKLSRLLEEMKVSSTGSGAVASALASSADMTRNLYKNNFLRTPSYEALGPEDLGGGKIVEIFRNYMHPVLVRPMQSAGSVSRLARSFAELKEAVRETLRESPRVIVEEHIPGEEFFATVLEDFKDEKLYAFEPVKSSDKPSKKLTKPTTKTIEEMAKRAHEALGLKHYSSSRFLVSPRGRAYILETESSPLFHTNSHLHKALSQAGLRHHDFVDHVIKLAL